MNLTGIVVIVLLQTGASLLNQTSSAAKLPNEQCLVKGLSEHVQHTLRDVTNFVVLPLDTLLALLSITCNAVILVTVLRTRSIQRPSLLFLCSLATTDMIWGILSAIDNTLFFILKNDVCPKEPTAEKLSLSLLCFFSTLGSLAIMSCDRLLALNNPWWYRSHATKSLAIKQIVLVWVIALIISSIGGSYLHTESPLLWSIYLFLITVCSLCYALIIIGCYIGVLIVNCRHGLSMDQYGGPMQIVLRRKKKIANTVGLILVVFCLSFLPAVIAPIILFHFGVAPNEIVPLRPLYYLFTTLNGLLNSLVNYGRNENVRRAVRSLIRCQRCCGGDRHGGRADNGQARRNSVPLRRTNRITVAPPQSTQEGSE